MMADVEVKIPSLHEGQRKIVGEFKRFNVLECGRRFGKTKLGVRLLCEAAVAALSVGWFAPTFKVLAEARDEIVQRVRPAIKSYSKIEGRLELINGGKIEFGSLDNPDAGRGRKYKFIVIDEASICRNLKEAWEQSLRPTLTDLKGKALFLGTPKGRNFFHQLYAKGQSGDEEWMSWRKGSVDNPLIDPNEIEAARRDLPLSVFEQEYLGIPADDGGNPFDIQAIRDIYQPNAQRGEAEVFGGDLAKSVDWNWFVGLDEDGNQAVSERWQGDWGGTRERVKNVIGLNPALIDSTGVGDPIVEDLAREIGLDVEGFKFSGPSKQQLMEGLRNDIQQRAFTIFDEELKNELESFEYEYRPGGTVRYSAPDGLHDDGVMALALARHHYRNRGIGAIKSARSIRTVVPASASF